MESVHAAMMQPNGLLPALRELVTKRKARYLSLKNRFCRLVLSRKKSTNEYVIPCPPSMSQYMEQNKGPCRHTIQNLWMEYSRPYEDIAEAIMESIFARTCYRMDGTMKIGKKRFLVDEKNAHVNPEVAKVLMLVVNEIGQWRYFSFRKEEDGMAVRDALMSCREAQEQNGGSNGIAIILGNATAYRNIIKSVFDGVGSVPCDN